MTQDETMSSSDVQASRTLELPPLPPPPPPAPPVLVAVAVAVVSVAVVLVTVASAPQTGISAAHVAAYSA